MCTYWFVHACPTGRRIRQASLTSCYFLNLPLGRAVFHIWIQTGGLHCPLASKFRINRSRTSSFPAAKNLVLFICKVANFRTFFPKLDKQENHLKSPVSMYQNRKPLKKPLVKRIPFFGNTSFQFQLELFLVCSRECTQQVCVWNTLFLTL